MFKLPNLKFGYKELEPYIDEQTMLIHHTKHHQAYIDNLNKALDNNDDLQKLSINDLMKNLDKVPENIRQTVINNGGGHVNHSFFWEIMHPPIVEEVPNGKLLETINSNFDSFEKFKEVFTNHAMTVFGSGWCFLIINKDKKLSLKRHSFQNSPVMNGNVPILGVDMWEHAYYLKYQNRKLDYINAWWHVVNWQKVSEIFETAL